MWIDLSTSPAIEFGNTKSNGSHTRSHAAAICFSVLPTSDPRPSHLVTSTSTSCSRSSRQKNRDDNLPDEVFFLFKQPDEACDRALRLYAGARAMASQAGSATKKNTWIKRTFT